MVGHPEDRFFDTREMLEEVRRPKVRMDQAIVVAAVALGLCGVWAASRLDNRGPTYEFIRHNDAVFVLNRYTGNVAACRLAETVVCTEEDSAMAASIRAP